MNKNYNEKMIEIDKQFKLFLGDDYLNRYSTNRLFTMLNDGTHTLLADTIQSIYDPFNKLNWRLYDYTDRFYRAIKRIKLLTK